MSSEMRYREDTLRRFYTIMELLDGSPEPVALADMLDGTVWVAEERPDKMRQWIRLMLSRRDEIEVPEGRMIV